MEMEIAIISDPIETVTVEYGSQVPLVEPRCGLAVDRSYNVSQAASGFVWAKISGVYIYSCYTPPSLTLSEFEEMLYNLILDGRGRSPKGIAGDFNDWAIEWSSRESNAKGRSLLEAFAQMDIVG